MESLIITPKDKAELKLLSELLKKMDIHSRVISEEEKENIGLIAMMKEADRTQKVSKEAVLKKLKNNAG